MTQGPTVTLYFETAEGLEAGKTKVKYQAVDVGTVDSVTLRMEKPQVVVTCTFDRDIRSYLTEGTAFWVVRPRVGVGGISGLSTLVSGAYVTLVPGPPKGTKTLSFVGLETPPLTTAPGLKVVLHNEKLHSLDAGSPIYFREIQVGTVEAHQLSKDGAHIDFGIHIDKEYAHLLKTNSRFWNAGGIDLSAGFGKLDLQIESIQALIAGGIAFDSPPGGKPAEEGASYWLHDSRSEIQRQKYAYGGLALIVETPQLGGLKDGDPVYYREVRVGSVTSHELSRDSKFVRVHLNIQNRYAPLVSSNTVFWNASGISANLGLTGIHVHAESLEALMSGGLAFATPPDPGHSVTEGSVFQLHPEVKDAWLKWEPMIWRGPPGEKPAQAAQAEKGVSRFFHHKDKKAEEATADSESQRDAKQKTEKKKHHFFRNLMGGEK
jgi:paraquat-inducible protein B